MYIFYTNIYDTAMYHHVTVTLAVIILMILLITISKMYILTPEIIILVGKDSRLTKIQLFLVLSWST